MARLCNALLALPLLLICAGAQDPSQAAQALAQGAAEPDETAKITKYLDLAIRGRISVRPQAAKRLVKMGDAARARIQEACGENGAQLAELGPYLVEVLADFGDSELRGYLWQGLRDLDFPWRGPAARSLGQAPLEAEVAQLLALNNDRLDQVRLAAIESLDRMPPAALEALQTQSREALLRLVHRDPSDRVRRAAALRLDLEGEHGYLLWLVEDLRRTDTYFRLPLGEQARFAANRALKKRLGQDFGFRAEDPPTSESNAQAIAQIQAAVLARVKGPAPQVPDALRAAQKTEGDLIGLELRSCRVGEFFLRWNRADVLYIGTGKGLAVPLIPGTVERLDGALKALVASLGKERYWGEVGCDLEQLRLVNDAGSVDAFLISKGQASVPDLRPAALDRAVALLVASIPAEEHSELVREVTRALEVLGGEF